MALSRLRSIALLLLLLGLSSEVSGVDCTSDGGVLPAGCCKLTQEVPEKPFPSLTQCYKYNTNTGACCKSGHDSHIADEYSTMLTPACLREFGHLEFYFCLGCNDKQWDYVDNSKDPPEVRVCRSFANLIFAPPNNGEPDPISDRFDRCGLNLPVENTNVDVAASWELNSWKPSADGSRQIVMPYEVFPNASEFFSVVKPPFFEDYKITVVDDDGTCFSTAHKVASAWAFVPIMLVVAAAVI